MELKGALWIFFAVLGSSRGIYGAQGSFMKIHGAQGCFLELYIAQKSNLIHKNLIPAHHQGLKFLSVCLLRVISSPSSSLF